MMYHQKYVRRRAKSLNAEDNKDLDLYDALFFLNFIYIIYMYWKRKEREIEGTIKYEKSSHNMMYHQKYVTEKTTKT